MVYLGWCLMSSKQSQKGSRFEYKIRDMLTEKTGVEWARAPSSGSGIIKGDLFCPYNHYFYCFECKSYKDSVIQENLLTAKSNNIYAWWEQCLAQAEKMKKKPGLVFKKDRGKPFIAVQEQEKSLFGIHLHTEWGEMYIYPFEYWLEFKRVEELILNV